MVITLLLIQQLLTLHTAAQTWVEEDEMEMTAKLSDRIRVRAAGQSNKWISLNDGREMMTEYTGKESVVQSLEQNQARALSLASDDFDEDGTDDLVCGYAAPTGGIVALHRGVAKSPATMRPGETVLADTPFIAPARVFALAEAADFLVTGDFDADGNRDVVAAPREGASLYLMRGNGQGGLRAAERIELPGAVTAMAAGEINRADGLEDLAVAVTVRDGSKVLVYEGPNGALRGEPEVLSLSTRVTSLAIGQLDSSYEYDLAITAGNELMIAYGRDRKLSMDKETQSKVSDVFISRQDFSFEIAAVATGEFIREGYQTDIALLAEDGRVRYLRRGELGRGDESGRGEWQVVTEAVVTESTQADNSPSPRSLITANISGLATDDLMVIDRASRKMRIISGGPGSKLPLHTTTSLEAEDQPMAALPVRMNGRAVNGFVAITGSHSAPALMLTPAAIVTIMVTTEKDNGNNDAPIPGSLRDAIVKANNEPPDSSLIFIKFQKDMRIEVSVPLPTISRKDVVINGPENQKQVTLENVGTSQAALFITGGSSNVGGLTFSGFSTGIRLEGGGENFIGFNSISGGRIGVEIVNSDDNSVSQNTITNADFAGVRITGESKENEVQLNTITENKAGAIIDGNASNNTIGGFFVINLGNAILRNDVGVLIGGRATGNLVQGNVIVDTSQDGLLITEEGAFNFIGGSTPQLGNKIIGSGANGIRVGSQAAEGAKIQGNFIGVKDDRTPPPASGEGNKGDGVRIEGAPNTETGGTSRGAGNTIGKNKGNGVSINNVNTGTTLVQGNKIGTDPTGATTDPDGRPGSGDETGNQGEGVSVFNSTNVTIGGKDPGAANIVGGNGDGMSLINSSNNTVHGNFWGTNPLDDDLGNRGAGVGLAGNSSNNKIGGDVLAAGNTIAYNQTGIQAGPITVSNLYLFNRIYRNTSSPINNNGGANRGIGSPQLITSVASTSDTRIAGKLSAQLPPSRSFAVFFYGGQVEIGRNTGPAIPIGGIIVNTDSSGSANFTARVPVPISAGLSITAIATDVRTNDTSEVSNHVQVAGTARPDLEVTKSGPATANCRDSITYTITVTNRGTAAAVGASVIDILDACLADEVTVTSSQEGSVSYPEVANKVVTVVPRLNPGDSVMITVMVTVTEICGDSIVNLVRVQADGDTNTTNDEDDVLTNVDCTKIDGISVQGKHVTVSGAGFVRGDKIEINGTLLNTKFKGTDELLAKRGKKELLGCDPANPNRKNVIKLIRSSNPNQPIQDTSAFATCP